MSWRTTAWPWNQPPVASSFPPSFALPLFTEQSEGNCLTSWEPGSQRQQLLGCSDFLVPPLFFLNFVLLLVFLLCRIFLSPSPFWPVWSPRTAGWEGQLGRSCHLAPWRVTSGACSQANSLTPPHWAVTSWEAGQWANDSPNHRKPQRSQQ